MAFDGKVNPIADKKLDQQLRQLDRRDRTRRIRRRRAVRRVRQQDDMHDNNVEEEQEITEETYLDRWKQKPFSWF
jgi:hypothetical protein